MHTHTCAHCIFATADAWAGGCTQLKRQTYIDACMGTRTHTHTSIYPLRETTRMNIRAANMRDQSATTIAQRAGLPKRSPTGSHGRRSVVFRQHGLKGELAPHAQRNGRAHNAGAKCEGSTLVHYNGPGGGGLRPQKLSRCANVARNAWMGHNRWIHTHTHFSPPPASEQSSSDRWRREAHAQPGRRICDELQTQMSMSTQCRSKRACSHMSASQ